MMKTKINILIVLLGFSTGLFSQGFTNINAGLIGTHWGDVAWGDYDADGDLDVLVTGVDAAGSGVTKIYKNSGTGMFTEMMGLNIPGTFVGDVVWGDYDADGDLDILIQGFTDGEQICKLYKNAGGDSFLESNISFPPLADGSLSFVDYNNDGFIDMMAAGYDGTIYTAILYKNNGNTTFSESNVSLPGSIKSSYEWADYDMDGDMDVFITGLDAEGILISKLYDNNGNDTFSESLVAFDGAWLGDAAWGDYDNDGDLDLLLSGYTLSTERIAKVYKNNGDGGFSELIFSGLVGVSHCSTIWGDYDNDGDLDVFIGGTYEGDASWVRVTDVFINNGNDTFNAAGFNFSVDAYWGESAWGDYDNDGDLDLICCGFDDVGGSHTNIYRNEHSTSNTAPDFPENLLSEITENEVLLSWDAASDNETPSAGLSYNAYIKNENGDVIWNSMSIMESGFNQIPSLGNAGQNTSWVIENLALGNYIWSVQAMDHLFAGSEFSIEESFSITYVGIDESSNPQKLSIFPIPAQSQITFQLPENTKGALLHITDIYGKTIAEISVNCQTELIWNCSEIASGVYFYRAVIDGLLYSDRLIVK